VTPLSGRLAAPALALLLAAVVPIWVRAVADPAPDACGEALLPGTVEALPGTLAARERPDLRVPGLSQWTEGEIAPPADGLPPLRFRIVRSSDPTAFYGEPIGYFSGNSVPDARRGLLWLESGADRLPVHWRYDDSEAAYVIRYLFVQDGRPVRHPLRVGLANAARQVAIGTRPVTLLLVDGVGIPIHGEAIGRAAEAWLREAWQRYASGCRG
jgi:hypothetical protein